MTRCLALTLLLSFAAGCGRVGFDLVSVDAGDDALLDAGVLDAGGASDAAVDLDASRGDAGQDAGLPEAGATDAGPPDAGPSPTFAPPTAVAELNTPSGEVDLTLTGDELEIFFITRAGPGIWTATRPNRSSAWSAPRQVPELLGEGDGDPEVSSDGLRMRFTSTRPGGAGSSDLWESTRPDRDGAWATPTPLTELNTEEAECCGTTDEADRLMVYASRRGGLTASDLFVATRASTTEPWGGVTAAAELNTADTESNPHVREEGRLLVFDSDRPGGAGLRDLYFSQRAAVSEPWGEPVRLTELASPGNDRDAWLSLDGRRIYFTSDRTGDFEIYVASR